MSMMRLTGCCCPTLVSNCNAWMAQCFGSTDPTTFPQTGSVNGSGGMSYTSACLCGWGAISVQVSESFSFAASGPKMIQPYWGNGEGIAYDLTGSFSFSVNQRTYFCDYEYDYDGQGNQIVVGVSSRLMQTVTQVGGGTCTGRLRCGAISIPNAQGQCGFAAAFYRGWELNLGNTDVGPASITLHGDFCPDGQDCTETYEAFAGMSATCVWGGGCNLNQPHDSDCNLEYPCPYGSPPFRSGRIGRIDYGIGNGTYLHAPGFSSVDEPAYCLCTPSERVSHSGTASMQLL